MSACIIASMLFALTPKPKDRSCSKEVNERLVKMISLAWYCPDFTSPLASESPIFPDPIIVSLLIVSLFYIISFLLRKFQIVAAVANANLKHFQLRHLLHLC